MVPRFSSSDTLRSPKTIAPQIAPHRSPILTIALSLWIRLACHVMQSSRCAVPCEKCIAIRGERQTSRCVPKWLRAAVCATESLGSARPEIATLLTLLQYVFRTASTTRARISTCPKGVHTRPYPRTRRHRRLFPASSREFPRERHLSVFRALIYQHCRTRWNEETTEMSRRENPTAREIWLNGIREKIASYWRKQLQLVADGGWKVCSTNKAGKRAMLMPVI